MGSSALEPETQAPEARRAVRRSDDLTRARGWARGPGWGRMGCPEERAMDGGAAGPTGAQPAVSSGAVVPGRLLAGGVAGSRSVDGPRPLEEPPSGSFAPPPAVLDDEP